MYIRKLIQVRVTGYQNVFFLTDIPWYLLKFRNVIHGLSLAVYFCYVSHVALSLLSLTRNLNDAAKRGGNDLVPWYLLLLKFRNVIHGLSLAVYFMRICQAWGSFGVLYLALRSTALEFLVCYA